MTAISPMKCRVVDTSLTIAAAFAQRSLVAKLSRRTILTGGYPAEYGRKRISGSAASTGRYLDPPVEDNFTNT